MDSTFVLTQTPVYLNNQYPCFYFQEYCPRTTVEGSFNYNGYCSPLSRDENNTLLLPRFPHNQNVLIQPCGPQRLTSKNLRCNSMNELSNEDKFKRIQTWINSNPTQQYYPHPIDLLE
ncbi:hypothetical protein QTN25_005145 [Entamoeba marina]